MNGAPDAPGFARFAILGPLTVEAGGASVPVPARRQRALLVLLLLNPGQVVSAERLIDQLWDGDPPPQAAVTLRSYISHIRRSFGAHGLAGVLATRGPGYAMDVEPDSIDAVRLERMAERGRERLRHGDAQAALEAFESALSEWRGDPIPEIADHQTARGSVAALIETHQGASEGRLAALIAVGRNEDAIPALEALIAEHPLREEPRAMLMTALDRSGRAPEALEVHRRFRALLQDELGIDPSPRLDRVRQEVLEQTGRGALSIPTRTTPPLVEAPSSGRPLEHGPGRSIIGRERELASLSERLESLRSEGRGSIVVISGEPGIGKSTLLEWLASRGRSRGLAVHTSRVPSASGAPPFWPWMQVIDSIAATMSDAELAEATGGPARHVATLSTSVATRTGGPPPPSGDEPQAMRFAVYEAVREFLERASRIQTTVIVIDDLQWADVPTLELVAYLAPSLTSHPVLLAISHRSLPRDQMNTLDGMLATLYRDEGAQSFVLGGLRREALAELAAVAAGGDPDNLADDVVEALVARTGGNPLFLRQLTAVPGECAWLTDPRAPAIPTGLRHLVASRLNSLHPTSQRFVEAAAVIGRDFELGAARVVADLDLEAALDAFDEAQAHGLLEDSPDRDGARRFVHAVVQECVIERLGAKDAGALHARAADLLSADPSVAADTIAEHYWAARDFVGARATPHMLSAADASIGVYAHERAEVHLRRALALSQGPSEPDMHQELSILLRLLQVISIGRGWGDSDVRAVLDRTMAITDAEALRDDTARLWWSLFFFLLDRDDAENYCRAARKLLDALARTEAAENSMQRGDDRVEPATARPGHAARGAVHLMAVFERLYVEDRSGAEDELRAARAHIVAASPDSLAAYNEHLHVMLLLIEAYWYALHDEVGSCEAAADEAVAVADADGRPFVRAVARVLGVSCMSFFSAPTSVDLRPRIADARAISTRYGYSWLERLSVVYGAWSSARETDGIADAEQSIVDFLEEVQSAGRFGNVGIVLLMLADVRARAGRPTGAREALDLAIQRPGPYAGLAVDVLTRRRDAVGADGRTDSSSG